MSVTAGAIEETMSFKTHCKIWSGPLALYGVYARGSFFHSIYLNVEGWRSITCAGSHSRRRDHVIFGEGTDKLPIQDL